MLYDEKGKLVEEMPPLASHSDRVISADQWADRSGPNWTLPANFTLTVLCVPGLKGHTVETLESQTPSGEKKCTN